MIVFSGNWLSDSVILLFLGFALLLFVSFCTKRRRTSVVAPILDSQPQIIVDLTQPRGVPSGPAEIEEPLEVRQRRESEVDRRRSAVDVRADNPSLRPSPLSSPKGNQRLLGWTGNISRAEAEDRLRSLPPGTFMLRWSEHTKSFVFSFMDTSLNINHLAWITMDEDGTTHVKCEGNKIKMFASLEAYIEIQRRIFPFLVGPVPVDEAVYHNVILCE